MVFFFERLVDCGVSNLYQLNGIRSQRIMQSGHEMKDAKCQRQRTIRAEQTANRTPAKGHGYLTFFGMVGGGGGIANSHLPVHGLWIADTVSETLVLVPTRSDR